MQAPSFSRIFRYAAYTLIGLSAIGQLARLAATPGGTVAEQPVVLAIIVMTAFTALPGLLLAIGMLVYHAIRAVKHKDARIKAVIFLAVAVLPFLGRTPQEDPRARRLDGVDVVHEESDQFLSGAEWAAANLPLRGSQCPGSEEFIRGCRSNITERQKANVALGRAWAQANQPALASACRGPVPYVVLGCRQYYFEHLAKPKPAGQGKYEGMTTAQCKEEVNANFEASENLDLENGNPQSAAVTRRRHWEPELRDCENYDKLVENTFMPAALARLEKVQAKLAAGQAVSPDEHAALLKDFTQMASVHDQPYKTYYLKEFDKYTAGKDGK
jgi:hypothetical protein